MPAPIHLDQAIDAACSVLRDLIAEGLISKAVLVNDLFARLRVAVWTTHADVDFVRNGLTSRLQTSSSPFWSEPLWIVSNERDDDQAVAETAWAEATGMTIGDPLRINDRHRSRTSWFLPAPSHPALGHPPVVAFYSFKGGVGRTTAAAALAISRARRGQRVAVIDFDLDAPGIGRLLDSDGLGTTAAWGVVDYLLESVEKLPLEDYRHTCARGAVTGDGVIDVYPAGIVDEKYLSKLGKVDLELRELKDNPLTRLIERISVETRPELIIIDSRAGLATAAGLVIGGVAHLHVVVSTSGEQSLSGLRLVIRRLGEDRLRAGQEQAECVLVHGMVPDHSEIGVAASEYFQARAEEVFRDHYYASEPDPEDRVWSLRDLDSSESPHHPATVRYKSWLADFRTIDAVANDLSKDDDYAALTSRIDARLLQFVEGESSEAED